MSSRTRKEEPGGKFRKLTLEKKLHFARFKHLHEMAKASKVKKFSQLIILLHRGGPANDDGVRTMILAGGHREFNIYRFDKKS